MTKFMNTKERCLHCGDKLPEKKIKMRENIIEEHQGDLLKFCNSYCLYEWQQLSKMLSI